MASTTTSTTASMMASAKTNLAPVVDWAKRHPYWAFLAGHTILSTTLSITRAAVKAWKERIRSNTVIELTLRGVELVETNQPSFAASLFPNKMYLADLIYAIESAREHPQVKGMVIQVDSFAQAGLAQLQEIRLALQRFRKAGKIIVAFADTFGELTVAWPLFYLASVANHIFCGISGQVGLSGLLMTQPFLKNALEKFEVQAHFSRRKEFKTAVNMFTQEKMDADHAEMLQDLANSLWNEVTLQIAESRDMDAEKLRQLATTGPFSAIQAKELGLIDGIAYRDQVYDQLWDLCIENKTPVSFTEYIPLTPSNPSVESTSSSSTSVATSSSPVVNKKKKIPNLLYLNTFSKRVGMPASLRANPLWHKSVAVISCEGTIHRGFSQRDQWTGTAQSIGSETIVRALRAATKDTRIAAIILRINSGGGSYTASDCIARAIKVAREAGKKVIVSMSSVCASGGYFMSFNADHVVCDSLTLTGSIGVFAGKMNFRGLLANKLGVTFDHFATSENATWNSSLFDYSKEGRDHLDHVLDFIYDDFTAKVALGRKLSREQVETAAKGRVWLGSQALKLGLVDSLGDFWHTLGVTRSLLQLAPDTPLKLVHYPQSKTFLQSLLGSAPANSEEDHSSISISSLTNSSSLLQSVMSSFFPQSLMTQAAQMASSPASLSSSSALSLSAVASAHQHDVHASVDPQTMFALQSVTGSLGFALDRSL